MTRSRNYVRINSQPVDFGTRGGPDPVGHGRVPIRSECPECRRQYAHAGGSCIDCADQRDRFVLIIDIFEETP